MTDSRLTVCLFFSITPSLLAHLKHQLPQDSFFVHDFSEKESFIQYVIREEQAIDCLILEEGVAAYHVLSDLKHHNLLLPCILVANGVSDDTDHSPTLTSGNISNLAPRAEGNMDGLNFYHRAMQHVSQQDIIEKQILQVSVEKSINRFLQLPAQSPLSSENRVLSDPALSQNIFTSLSNKQRRLSIKLQERLGYLGVYYKRNPDSFLKRMNLEEKQTFLNSLRKDYRDIILNYFSDVADLNQRIDRYITTAFFADVPTAQMVQIHMELMDEFSKQLKLEGRNEEILLDYRLTLIDMLANLCELYRRSIPRL